jgi:hypothetical protein
MATVKILAVKTGISIDQPFFLVGQTALFCARF